MPHGFILVPTYRVERGRPVVLLYGKLESGAPFLVRDRRQSPRFWILRADSERARAAGASVRAEERDRIDFDGRSVVAVDTTIPAEVPPLRECLRSAGVPCFEADVRFAYRYLIDRGIRGSCAIDGSSRHEPGLGEVFEEPELTPADWTPELGVLSLDIETDPAGKRLLSVALHGCGASEVLLLTPPGYDAPGGSVACADERELVARLCERVREIDPDVLTGWNLIDFDLAFLERHAARLGVPLQLGRGPGALLLRRSSQPHGASRAELPGRVALDGPQLVRGAFVRLEGWSLESAAQQLLGRGKLITGPDRAHEIVRAFERDRAKLVAYNLEDARLVTDILDVLHLVPLAVERSRLTGMPIDRVSASVAAFDFLYLSRLAPRGIVAPAHDAAVEPIEPTSGGHVLEPAPGLYYNVCVLDFKSLYPSLIRTFNIDPLALVRSGPRTDVIVAPNGAAFRREPGILPGLLDELFPRREAARAAGDGVASQAIKILMNSFYGVLGTSACRFAAPELANAVTGFGREVLLWTKARIEARGLAVLYGDTDSLFVRADAADPDEARALGGRLARELNIELADWIRERWNVTSRLDLVFETLYLRLLLPLLRHGGAGARKRYAGLVAGTRGPEVVFTGLEVVRSDWTELARRVQRELYERLFTDRPVAEYLRGIVTDLRAGKLDDLLVYRKSLRKGLGEYTASTPPHVAAARKMAIPPRRSVAYVVTRAGPEPVRERSSPIDHEHYVERQLRPVAEPVLQLLRVDFDQAIGSPHQARLF